MEKRCQVKSRYRSITYRAQASKVSKLHALRLLNSIHGIARYSSALRGKLPFSMIEDMADAVKTVRLRHGSDADIGRACAQVFKALGCIPVYVDCM